MRVSLQTAISYEDMRRLAQRRLPKVVFDFIDGGAGAEQTLQANCEVFQQVALRPRQANAPAAVDLTTAVLGSSLKLPVLLAPCGSARIIHPGGERAIASAAARAGTVYVVPHLGGTSCEQVHPAQITAPWYQIYQYGGRAVCEPAVRRAWNAGFRTLVVTIDNGRTLRERDARNGLGSLMSGSPWQTLPHIKQLLARPRWLAGYLRDGNANACPNAILPEGRPMSVRDLTVASARPDSQFHWRDFHWLRDLWPGNIVAKGVLTAGDARRAVDSGVNGIIVSNHGGRTMDGLEASLRALPEVAAAVPTQIAVLLDGGIRRAPDVLKALCLGARAVLIGRPYMFALSHGEAGVARMLELLETDLRLSLATLGCASPSELHRDLVRVPAEWELAEAAKSSPQAYPTLTPTRLTSAHGQINNIAS